MSDATVEGLQCHPDGDTEGGKARPGRAQKEAACWLRVREEGRCGEERGGDLCRPPESIPGWFAGPGESGS